MTRWSRFWLWLSRVFMCVGLGLVVVELIVVETAPSYLLCFGLLASAAALILMSLICYCLTLGPGR